MELTEQQIEQVRAHLHAGRKVEAIRIYREMSGLGLAEAKAAVEAMEQGGGLPAGRTARGLPEPDADEIEREVRRALREGTKIQAIRRYREMTGADLKDSKDAVDLIEARFRAHYPEYAARPARSGCLGAVAIVLAVSSLLGWLALA